MSSLCLSVPDGRQYLSPKEVSVFAGISIAQLEVWRRETEQFYTLLNGWELECPEDGVMPSDVLELIAELADVMGFSATYVADYLKLHQGEDL